MTKDFYGATKDIGRFASPKGNEYTGRNPRFRSLLRRRAGPECLWTAGSFVETADVE
jgi:hypothetical protein